MRYKDFLAEVYKANVIYGTMYISYYEKGGKFYLDAYIPGVEIPYISTIIESYEFN